MRRIPTTADLIGEIGFTASRSSGPGGQNVNKVNSKVTLRFDVLNSLQLNDEQKATITAKLSSYLTKEGVLLISVQENRSQHANKETALQKLDQLFVKIFTPRKVRKASKPSKAAVRGRLKAKKHNAEKKQWRSKKMD